jgi:hypothetical protein
MSGRSIKIFLIDGVATGLRTAELGLSTIKALVIPRGSLSAATKRPEVQKTGVYILIGRDAEKSNVLKIYLGEGDTVLSRLVTHDKDPAKDFWEDAVIFVSKDDNLTKAHGRYVESRLISFAHDAKRCIVTNGTQPPDQGRLPEADQVEMDEFISQAQILLGTLGYDLFSTEEAPTVKAVSSSAAGNVTQIDLLCSGQGYSATCTVDINSGQFIVRKGSLARKEENASFHPTYHDLRQLLLETGVLVDEAGGLRFTQDYAFSAISPAANVVTGQTVNGRNTWKLNSGLTFGEWQQKQIEQTTTEPLDT